MVKTPIVILSIAGSDNSSGAGIQADIKTALILKAYCLNSLTTITAQNSKSVVKVEPVNKNLITLQIKSLIREYKVDCIKIGLVTNVETAKSITNVLKNMKDIPIIVDPIFKSSTNIFFQKKKDFINIYKIFSLLKPYLTPNYEEAKVLADIKKKKNDIPNLQEKLNNIFNSISIITGHQVNEKTLVTYLQMNNINYQFRSKKINSKNTHGSGCLFSTSLAIFLARGHSINESIKMSNNFVRKSIEKAPYFGLKYGPIGH